MKFNIITFGCKVNTYESNVMNDILIKNGFVEVSKDADVYIINTCTVTDKADSKVSKVINKIKDSNKDSIVVAVGCFVQINKDNMKNTNIDILIGNKNKTKIYDHIMNFKKNKQKIVDVDDVFETSFENMEIESSKKTRAFVKIQDGCDNYCSYCIIPYARGSVRSRDKKDILDEVKRLVAKGHKEIVLTGIHTGSYGSDLNNYKLVDLLKDLIKIDELIRIRVSSIEITEIDDEFLHLLKTEEKIASHLHIPLQSGSDDILLLMNRKYNKDYFITKIKDIKNARNDISITTDVIVGFPNESENNFSETVDTINQVGFTSIHVFPYSKRKNTKAYDMDGHLSEDVKKKRVDILLKLSKELESKYNKKFIDKELDVIVEKIKEGYATGHTSNYLKVSFKTNEDVKKDLVKVKLKQINDNIFIGKKA